LVTLVVLGGRRATVAVPVDAALNIKAAATTSSPRVAPMTSSGPPVRVARSPGRDM
jgi:hypothetical protein